VPALASVDSRTPRRGRVHRRLQSDLREPA
jgi:hypothetical protein